MDIHEDLDRRGLPCAICPNQRENTPFRHIQIQAVQRDRAAKPLRKIDRPQYHFLPPSSRCQCSPSALVTSSSSSPTFFASTTSCSSSFLSRFPRSAAVDAAGSETTVPTPDRTSMSPSATRWVMTLCAVFGLIFSALLSAR